MRGCYVSEKALENGRNDRNASKTFFLCRLRGTLYWLHLDLQNSTGTDSISRSCFSFVFTIHKNIGISHELTSNAESQFVNNYTMGNI